MNDRLFQFRDLNETEEIKNRNIKVCSKNGFDANFFITDIKLLRKMTKKVF